MFMGDFEKQSWRQLVLDMVGGGPIARSILEEVECVQDLWDWSAKDWMELPGIGEVNALVIMSSLELGRRMWSQKRWLGRVVSNPLEVVEVMNGDLKEARVEKFYVLLLDSKNRCMAKVLVSQGSVNASIVHPREVFEPAIRGRAAAVIVVHNHPAGDPKPSREDIDVTRRLADAGKLLGIPVLDHVIVGDLEHCSMKALGVGLLS